MNKQSIIGLAVLLAGTGVFARADDSSVSGSSAIFSALSTEPVQLVQPEIDSSVLENLPKPPTTEPPIALPRVVNEKGQWRGSLCGITRPATLVFRKPETWQKFWTLAMAPYSEAFKALPNVDFSKYMVVGVFRGQEPYPNYQIQILSVAPAQRNGQRVLLVRFKPATAMMGVFIPPFQVQPFHLLRVPVFDGHVVFESTEP